MPASSAGSRRASRSRRGRVEGVASGESEGLRRPRPRRRRLGLRVVAPPDRGRGRPGRRARPSGSPAPAPPPCATGRASTTGRPPTARTRRRSKRTRSRSRSRPRSPTCSPPTRPPPASRASPSPSRSYAAQREWKTFAATDGSLTEQVITHVGVGGRGQRRRRRRAPAPELPGLGRRLAGGRLRVHPRPRPRRARPSRSPTRPSQLLTAPQCPSGRFTIVLDPSQLYLQLHESCGHPTELDRVFGTEASLRRHQLPDDRQARRGLPLRLGPHRHRRRRDGARRDGHVRLGRRGRRGAGRAARHRTASSSATCRSRETAPRIGRQSGGAMRADGWNRIPLIRMTNINLLPKPGMSLDEIVADTDDGLYLASNRSLVDRRPPPELPVRDRGRLRDQGRQEGPAVQEPDLHRHHLRVLAVVRRGRRRAEST